MLLFLKSDTKLDLTIISINNELFIYLLFLFNS